MQQMKEEISVLLILEGENCHATKCHNDRPCEDNNSMYVWPCKGTRAKLMNDER